MGCFITGPARLQQVNRRRVWKLLDNELFLDDNNDLYLVPRNFYTDNYTIPMFVALIAGSPVDWSVLPSHVHDLCCDTHSALLVKLTVNELYELGYLHYNKEIHAWVCENIPPEYLYIKKKNKIQANNLLNRCMKACQIPRLNRIIIRLGVCFNIGWYIDKWRGNVFELDIFKVYDEEYWDKNVWYK